MKILLLCPYPDRLRATFAGASDNAHVRTDKISPAECAEFDWLVSFGYRHILKANILDLFPRRAINVHIAMLPWNRGAHPNYWSWIDGTPKGVTIHEIDLGIDTGPIIAQRETKMTADQTFSETYEELMRNAEILFDETWPKIRCGDYISIPQDPREGSHHYARELPENVAWDSQISMHSN